MKRGRAARLLGLFLLLLLGGCRSVAPPQGGVVESPPASPRQEAGRIYLVIDDAGRSLEQVRRFLDIPVPMTIAVMPHRRFSEQTARLIAADPRKEAILHQPMAAYGNRTDPGAGAIYADTPPAAVPRILADNLATVPGAVGMNNHMGSQVTEQPELIRPVLLFCRTNGLFFLDSRTAYNSQVPAVARELGVHVEQRDVFLDIHHDREHILRRWREAVEKARRRGKVIVIGHAWSAETARVIAESLSELEREGIRFHLLSELYR